MPEWIFDKVGPSGFNSGESVLTQIFSSSSSLAKEPMQNAIDRISEANSNRAEGKIEIKLIEFTGTEKDEILKNLNWVQLQTHLDAVAQTSSEQYSDRLKTAVDRVNGETPLRFLVVSDYGTIGLPGDDFDKNTHINRLTRAAHITDKEQKNRDGSHGLGKGVFWKYSGVSTILFYSLTHKENMEIEHRFIGQSTLAHHKIDDDEFIQAGFFGEQVERGDGFTNGSAWGESNLLKKLELLRDKNKENIGTSVIVFDFDDPEVDEEQTGQNIIKSLMADCEKWFWPALSRKNANNDPALSLRLKFFRNGELKEELSPNLEKYNHYIEALDSEPEDEKITSPDMIAGSDINVEVPLLKNNSQGKFKEAPISIRLKSFHAPINVKDIDKHQLNHVALLRRKTMVINYEEIKVKIDEGVAVVGVVAAGYARGNSDEDKLLHNFLRDMEPAAHDSWDKYYDKLKLYSHGARARRTEIIRSYKKCIKQICSKEVDTKGKTVPALASMLRFKGLGKKKKNYTVSASDIMVDKDTNNKLLKISFSLYCNDIPSAGTWKAGIKVKIKGISEPLKFLKYSEVSPSNAVSCQELNNKKEELRITVQNDDRVDYTTEMAWHDYLSIDDDFAFELLVGFIREG